MTTDVDDEALMARTARGVLNDGADAPDLSPDIVDQLNRRLAMPS